MGFAEWRDFAEQREPWHECRADKQNDYPEENVLRRHKFLLIHRLRQSSTSSADNSDW